MKIKSRFGFPLLFFLFFIFTNQMHGLPNNIITKNNPAEKLIEQMEKAQKSNLKWGERFVLKMLKRKLKRQLKKENKRNKRSPAKTNQQDTSKNKLFGFFSLLFVLFGIAMFLAGSLASVYTLLLDTVAGIISLVQIKKNPEKYGGKKWLLLAL